MTVTPPKVSFHQLPLAEHVPPLAQATAAGFGHVGGDRAVQATGFETCRGHNTDSPASDQWFPAGPLVIEGSFELTWPGGRH